MEAKAYISSQMNQTMVNVSRKKWCIGKEKIAIVVYGAINPMRMEKRVARNAGQRITKMQDRQGCRGKENVLHMCLKGSSPNEGI